MAAQWAASWDPASRRNDCGRIFLQENGLNDQQWFIDVLERIHSHKRKNLYQLLPKLEQMPATRGLGDL